MHRAVWDLIVYLDFLQAALQSPGFQEWACINRLCVLAHLEVPFFLFIGGMVVEVCALSLIHI